MNLQLTGQKTLKKNTNLFKTFQYFWPCIKPSRFLALGFILFSLVKMVVDLAQAYLYNVLIDTALKVKQGILLQYIIFTIVIFIISFILTYILKTLYGSFGAGFLHDFRYHTLRHIQQISVSKLEKYHSGDLLSRLNNDISIVQDFVGNTLLDLLRQIIMFIAATAYMACLNWKLLVVSIAVFPPSLIAVNILLKPMKDYYKEANASLGKANAMAQDAFGGIFTIKAFNLQAAISRKYGGNIDRELDFNLKAARINRWIPLFRIALNMVPSMVYMGYGSYLIVRGEMTPGELVAFWCLMDFVQWPLAFLVDVFNNIKKSMGAMERVAEIFDIPNERTDGADFSKTAPSVALSFEHVDFAYHEGTEVLTNLNFTVLKGQKIAIVGASGCGKSTILKLLCGDYETHRGEIKVYGENTRDWNLNALRSIFTVISQEIFLFPVSIQENIAYGRPKATQDEIIAAAKVANAHEFIMELPDGYNTLVGERGIKLSGGQKQRIALARAIVKNAPILLLDEPTSALDTHSEALVQEAIERSLRDKTAIIIAHRLSTIKKVDRILVMDKGCIVAQGTHEELLAENELYNELYLKQFNSAETQEITGSE